MVAGILSYYAFFTLAPMLTGTVPDDELPELNTPLVTSEVSWIYCPGSVSATALPYHSYLRPGVSNTHKAVRVVASCAEEQLE